MYDMLIRERKKEKRGTAGEKKKPHPINDDRTTKKAHCMYIHLVI